MSIVNTPSFQTYNNHLMFHSLDLSLISPFGVAIAVPPDYPSYQMLMVEYEDYSLPTISITWSLISSNS